MTEIMRKVKAIIERSKDGHYSIYMDVDVREISYLLTGTGETIEEAKTDFLNGYVEMKAFYDEKGKDFEEVEFDFEIDVVSFLTYYATVFTLSGLAKITGIAQGQLSHYVNGKNRPNKKNEDKILEGLRTFGKDIAQLG